MTFEKHPESPAWMIGPEVTDARGAPPPSPQEGMLSLFGAAPGDWDHRVYLVPARTLIEEVVEFFEVGTKGALAHGWDERDTMDLVADKLTAVDALVPGSIELADSGALRFRFWRAVTSDDLDKFEELYRGVDELQAGLELYLNGASGASPFEEIRDTGVLQLRWV